MIYGLVPGQVIVGAAVFGAAILAVGVACTVVLAVWAAAEWWRDRRHDVGPDALRLLQDVDQHLDRFVLDDPEVQAGLARLDAAVRAEHEGGTA